ncbi:MAG: amidohydrolase family protein [Deltaproteobacteria bacterium]|nr:amidohydrolase family protein [Deltaproteobacteria bacterium]
MTMKPYDAHIHFYFPFPPDELRRVFHHLTKIGLAGFNALVFAEFPSDIETVLKMVPGAFHNVFTLSVLENQKDPFPYFEWAEPLTIVPFVDARFIENGIEEKIKGFKQNGFKGLKIIYIPEEDTTIRVKGMEQAFGRPVKKSEDITARLIESASSQGMCVLLHADLRRYGDFVNEMIRSYPQTNFNVPHFGFSRKTIIHLLETYPNCYTDTSSLVPFMTDDPLSYKSFIREYQDKILFGSDAMIGTPERVESSLRFVEQFLDDRETFHKIVHTNYCTYQGVSECP